MKRKNSPVASQNGGITSLKQALKIVQEELCKENAHNASRKVDLPNKTIILNPHVVVYSKFDCKI